jgi:hypothetical protein
MENQNPHPTTCSLEIITPSGLSDITHGPGPETQDDGLKSEICDLKSDASSSTSGVVIPQSKIRSPQSAEFLPAPIPSEPEPEPELPESFRIPEQPTLEQLITPDIDTPEYNIRVHRIRENYRRDVEEGLPIPEIRTIEEAEAEAIRVVRLIKKYGFFIDLIGDVLYFINIKTYEQFWDYKEPFMRASNYYPPDHAETDPVPLRKHQFRTRKKISAALSEAATEILYRKMFPDPEKKVRALYAISAAVKNIEEAKPRKNKGRSKSALSRLEREQRKLMGATHGGARTGSGRKRKNPLPPPIRPGITTQAEPDPETGKEFEPVDKSSFKSASSTSNSADPETVST